MSKRKRPRGVPFAVATSAAAAAVTLTITGCGGKPPVDPDASPTKSTSDSLPPRQLLAARAAQATDRYFTASYTLTGGAAPAAPTTPTTPPAQTAPPTAQPAADTPTTAPAATPTAAVGGGGNRTIMVYRIATGHRLDVADGGQITSIVHNGQGDFRCTLTGAAPSCVKKSATDAADAEQTLLKVFTSWPTELSNPASAITVTTPTDPPATTGCFQVDGVAASLDPPVDPGVYCYDKSGTLTGLKVAGTTLKLIGSGPPPPSLDLPAPLTAPPPTAVPTPTTPTPSATGR